MSELCFRYPLPFYDELIVRDPSQFKNDANGRPSEIATFEICLLTEKEPRATVLLPHCQLTTMASDLINRKSRHRPPENSIAHVDPQSLQIIHWPENTPQDTRLRYEQLLLLAEMKGHSGEMLGKITAPEKTYVPLRLERN